MFSKFNWGLKSFQLPEPAWSSEPLWVLALELSWVTCSSNWSALWVHETPHLRNKSPVRLWSPTWESLDIKRKKTCLSNEDTTEVLLLHVRVKQAEFKGNKTKSSHLLSISVIGCFHGVLFHFLSVSMVSCLHLWPLTWPLCWRGSERLKWPLVKWISAVAKVEFQTWTCKIQYRCLWKQIHYFIWLGFIESLFRLQCSFITANY